MVCLQYFLALVGLSLMMLSYAIALSPDELRSFMARTYIEDTVGYQGFVRISNYSAAMFQISANGIPDHVTGPFNLPEDSDDVLVQNFEYYIPKNPAVADNPTDLNMGPIGLAINGVAIFSPYSAQGTDAVITEERTFDECDGHPSPQGTYHYHGSPICVFEDVEGVPSSVVGVAMDGFPIYGPTDENGNRLFSEDLDDCHGRYVNGRYRYHITDDFPYILGCYKGEVDERNLPQGMGPNRHDQGGIPAPTSRPPMTTRPTETRVTRPTETSITRPTGTRMTNPMETRRQMLSTSQTSNAGSNDPLVFSGNSSTSSAQSAILLVTSCLAIVLSCTC